MGEVIHLVREETINDPVWAATDELIEKGLELLGNYEDAATAHVMAAVDTAIASEDPKNIATMAQWLRNVAERLEQEIED